MRQLVCQMDEWDGLTMDDIRRIEDETAARLAKSIKEGEVKSMLKEEAKFIVCFKKTAIIHLFLFVVLREYHRYPSLH